MRRAVLRILDNLVRFRGSMPLTNGSGFGSGSFYFHHRPSRCQQETNLKKFFCIILFEGTFTSFFKGKKSKRSHKPVEIKVFLPYHFWLMIEGSRRPKNTWIRWIRIRIRNKVRYLRERFFSMALRVLEVGEELIFRKKTVLTQDIYPSCRVPDPELLDKRIRLLWSEIWWYGSGFYLCDWIGYIRLKYGFYPETE